MKIEEIIQQAAALRDEVKNLVAEAKNEAPHLCNAAGALHMAVANLEGHLQALAAQSGKLD
jgi:hypothetical protein